MPASASPPQSPPVRSNRRTLPAPPTAPAPPKTTVSRSTSPRNPDRRWIRAKTPRSRREIALPSTVVALLRAHHTTIAAERLRLGHVWRNEDRVFPGEGGGPVGQTTIRKALDAALERAGLPHVRVHDLRHSAATALLAVGGSLRDVQEMLGHTSFAFTADRYAHVLEDQRRATAARIDGALGAAIGMP